MAPELLKGGKPTTASDVYALGVILSELISGERPQTAKPPGISRAWGRILERCLDPNPAQRFEDAGRLVQALETRPQPWLLGVIAAVLLAVVAGLITVPTTPPKQIVRLALLPFQSSQDAHLAEDLSRKTAVQLTRLKGNSQTKFIFVSGNHADTIQQLSARGATHVLHGSLETEDGDVNLHAYLTDTHSGFNKEWPASYKPADLRYAPVALAAMVTSALHVPPITANATVNAAARQDYDKGLSYLRKNLRPDQAVILLERAVAADPGSALAYAGLAEAQMYNYRLTHDARWRAKAQESVRQAELRNQDVSEVHTISGDLKANSGLYDLAKSRYERAVELQPDSGDAYRRLSVACDYNAQPNEAFVAIKKAIDVQPRQFLNYQQLGTLYIRRGDFEAALPEFQKMVALADLAETHFALGAALDFLGRFAEAETELRASLRLEDSSDYELELGEILLKVRRNREAITCFRHALDIGETSEIWLNLGIAYRREGLTSDAKASFHSGLAACETALMRNPREGNERARLAYMAALLGDRQRGESEIVQALAVSRDDSETRMLAVLTYEALGRREQSLGLLPGSPSILGQVDRCLELADLRRDPRFQELSRINGVH
jgi:tetratricopeptide (TPR) repeat protein